MAFAALLVQIAASYILNRLTQPNGPRVTNLAAGGGDYGVPKPIILGEKFRVVSVLIAEDEIKETVHKHKPATDWLFGIAGALLPSTKTYTYSVTLAVLLADRTNDEPIEGVTKLYAGGKVIFRASESAVVSETLDGQGRLVKRKYGKNKYCKSVTIYGGGFDQTADPILNTTIGNQPGYRGSAYAVLEDLQLKDFGNAPPLPIEALVENKTGQSLADAVEIVCSAAGIDPVRDMSSTALADQLLLGCGIVDQGSCWDAIKPLLPAYAADAAETAGQIRFYRRSQSMRATIPPDEMGSYIYGDSPPEKFDFNRSPDLNLPKATSVTFVDPERDYQPNTAKSERSEGDARSNLDVSIPIVLTADQGASAAALMHWDAWLGRSNVSFTLTDTWGSIETGLAYALSIADQFVPYRITRRTRGANGIIEVEAVSDESVTYTAQITGTSGTPIPPETTLFADTRIVAMDTAILNDTDDEYGFYVVMSGEEGWTEGEVQGSLDGITYADLILSSDEAVIGDVTGTLGAGTTTGLDDTLDTTTVLTVVLIDENMTLSSATDAELDTFENMAFVGKDGLGEYLQFKTATFISGSTWQLTNLRRGRKGSDFAIATHASGEEFALLTDGGVFRLPATTLDSWGVPISLRGVTLNQDEADADVIAFTNTGEGKRPYSPVNVEGTWDGSNNLEITWEARSRLNAGGLGIDDNFEFDIEITNAVPVRSDTVTVENFSYSAVDQASDGLTPGDSVDGRVRQTSDVNDGRWRNFTLVGPNTRIATETDLALALGITVIRAVGRSDETDVALELESPATAPVGMAAETDTALELTAPVTLGNILTPTTNVSVVANFQQGTAFQASQSFTANKMVITGPFTGTSSFTFRGCVYACTDATTWSGALQGETSPASDFANQEVREFAFISPISIVSGNWYALCIQPDSPGGVIGATAGGGRAFSDTYSDGAAATAGASFANAAALSCIYISS